MRSLPPHFAPFLYFRLWRLIDVPGEETYLKDELNRGRIDGIVACDHDVGTRDLDVHCGGGAFLGVWADSVGGSVQYAALSGL